jgi:hypothetical protein
MYRAVLATMALLIALAACSGSSSSSTEPTTSSSASTSEASVPASTPAASASEGEVVRGWPDTNENAAGVYSWDGSSCAGAYCTVSARGAFMHNGYGSGDVDITIDYVHEGAAISEAGWTAATIAGHDGLHRRIDAQQEEWMVEIEGTTIAIHLSTKPGTSQIDLDEAHAIIDSMRTETRDTAFGFRLVFTLTTDDWDSG